MTKTSGTAGAQYILHTHNLKENTSVYIKKKKNDQKDVVILLRRGSIVRRRLRDTLEAQNPENAAQP